MDHEQFWELIDRHVTKDDENQPVIDALASALAKLPADQIVAFDRIFTELYFKTYTWDLWGAAYLINGGCSDDGFDYFRGWLIASGREVFELAVRDPDSLAAVAEEDVWCEDILYIANSAHQSVMGGQDLPGNSLSYPDLGEDWDFDDDNEMQKRYPKLFAKFAGD